MSWPQIATYISYLFVVAAYTYKVMHVARMPMHLRWELYPVPYEKKRPYGGSYLEDLEWWKHPQERSILSAILNMLKKYLFFTGYYQKNRRYWVSLYAWHVGFYLIVLSHVLSFLSAFLMVTTGIAVSAGSVNAVGGALYYLTIIVAAVSYVAGSFGSIGLFIERRTDSSLRKYAAPYNYFNYVFFLIVFVSGFVAWRFFDPTFGTYREFWKGLITFKYMAVEPAMFTHVILFSLFLTYLPFTRSTHYITSLISFFGILWGDIPNLKGGEVRKSVSPLLNKHVTWSASHIPQGKKWSEVVSEEK